MDKDPLLQGTLRASSRMLHIRNKGDDQFLSSMMEQAADEICDLSAERDRLQGRVRKLEEALQHTLAVIENDLKRDAECEHCAAANALLNTKP